MEKLVTVSELIDDLKYYDSTLKIRFHTINASDQVLFSIYTDPYKKNSKYLEIDIGEEDE